jgi:hypothetical protein
MGLNTLGRPPRRRFVLDLHLEHGPVVSEHDDDTVSYRCGSRALSVDEDAVAALEIANDPLSGCARHFGVPAADLRVLQFHVAAGFPADVKITGETKGLPVG